MVDWEIPTIVIKEAEHGLRKIERAAQTSKKYQDHQKAYYDLITNNNSSPQSYWSGVYLLLRDDNEERVQLISKIFEHTITKNKLSHYEAVEMILTFIQEIEYYIPVENYFEI